MEQISDTNYNPLEWHLFIDSVKLSLKAVLLHNVNLYPSVPIAIARSSHMKQMRWEYEFTFKRCKFSKYEWQIYGDIKVIGLLVGMQSGFTNFVVFCVNDRVELKKNIMKYKSGF